MAENELPTSLQYLLIALQIVVFLIFLYLIWPNIKSENWKAKFIENKTARSILIVFIMILLFTWGLGAFFDTFFPIEEVR